MHACTVHHSATRSYTYDGITHYDRTVLVASTSAFDALVNRSTLTCPIYTFTIAPMHVMWSCSSSAFVCTRLLPSRSTHSPRQSRIFISWMSFTHYAEEFKWNMACMHLVGGTFKPAILKLHLSLLVTLHWHITDSYSSSRYMWTVMPYILYSQCKVFLRL